MEESRETDEHAENCYLKIKQRTWINVFDGGNKLKFPVADIENFVQEM
jgi:hypothetical protein